MSDLVRILSQLSNSEGKVYYYLNNGNAGDAVINMGFYTVAKKIGLSYSEIDTKKIDQVKDGDTVIIAGGGALVPEWTGTPLFLEALFSLGKNIKLIILPHSVRGIDELLNLCPKTTVIFCRERYSYDYCKQFNHIEEIYLEDDIAFRCDVSALLKEKVTFSPALNSENLVKKIFIMWHSLRSILGCKKIFAMRTDKERNSNSKFPSILRNDFSRIANFGANSYEESLYSSKALLKLIDQYEEVHTDRLHVAICAALLEKKVYIYDNGYYKCKGVYEYSMHELENVSFISND